MFNHMAAKALQELKHERFVAERQRDSRRRSEVGRDRLRAVRAIGEGLLSIGESLRRKPIAGNA